MRKTELIIFAITTITIVIIATLLVIFSTTSPDQPSPITTPRPSSIRNNFPSTQPSLTPSPTPSPIPISATTKDELVYQLPFQSDLFNIEYLSVSDLFAVTIKQNPYQENVNKANQWFIDRGFNPEQLNIYYHTFPDVQR